MKFFVVDDDTELTGMVAALLEARGHRVKWDTDAVGAIPEIAAFRPDCVITDLMMPAFDGEEFCRELRKRKDLDRTRIVMISARQNGYWADRARAVGADGYIRKPLDPLGFVDEVEAIVARA